MPGTGWCTSAESRSRTGAVGVHVGQRVGVVVGVHDADHLAAARRSRRQAVGRLQVGRAVAGGGWIRDHDTGASDGVVANGVAGGVAAGGRRAEADVRCVFPAAEGAADAVGASAAEAKARTAGTARTSVRRVITVVSGAIRGLAESTYPMCDNHCFSRMVTCHWGVRLPDIEHDRRMQIRSRSRHSDASNGGPAERWRSPGEVRE